MINKIYLDEISNRLNISRKNVENTIKLINEGATVPFIARYRKEHTGNLDEVQIGSINNLLSKFIELESRKKYILKSLEDTNNLSKELEIKIHSIVDNTELEDIYLPYKPKRKTKASIAKEKGLEPLAKIIMAQNSPNIFHAVANYLSSDVKTEEEAIEGAGFIIAEWVSENIVARKKLREIYLNDAILTTKIKKGKEEEGIKFKDYYSYSEPIKKIKSHRFLAIIRGEKEGIITVSIKPEENKALNFLFKLFIKNDASGIIEKYIKYSYKKLLHPSIENETKSYLKEKADVEAIKIFAKNLEQLLFTAPLGQKRILAIDPGFRTGCKIVCLSENGNLLYNETIYPHPPQNQSGQAIKKITTLIEQYNIEAIAIGNGTAGRETEQLIRRIKFSKDIQVFIVNEAGASIYSASKIAREEFPQYDVTVRGAVSIGRRLMDPLSELVKIEPKSIGVGQYQHDVNQNLLQKSLDSVVESCVNKIGVEVNTASKYLLKYVSGIGEQLAENIIEYRTANNGIKSRKDLKNIPRMGEKAFEQSAGFLRVSQSNNPLDNSAVHPESYHLVQKLCNDLGVTISEIIGNKTLLESNKVNDFLKENTSYTIKDIIEELKKPNRDPRKKAKVFEFDKRIKTIKDVEVGMVVSGVVSNITNFGCFVDIGAKQDGLVHISNLANEYIANPADFVQLGQEVKVKVIETDIPRKRIGLSMKDVG